jgi:hypothetical protein
MAECMHNHSHSHTREVVRYFWCISFFVHIRSTSRYGWMSSGGRQSRKSELVRARTGRSLEKATTQMTPRTSVPARRLARPLETTAAGRCLSCCTRLLTIDLGCGLLYTCEAEEGALRRRPLLGLVVPELEGVDQEGRATLLLIP